MQLLIKQRSATNGNCESFDKKYEELVGVSIHLIKNDLMIGVILILFHLIAGIYVFFVDVSFIPGHTICGSALVDA